MATHRPPVIAEIAKAYQNDPSTLMALAAQKAGSSTAPVAQGGWGVTDGIARVLQGLGGAAMNKQMQGQYSEDQDKLLALRQQRGVDGLSGAPAASVPPAAVATAAPPPQAAAVASALGAPPPAPPGPSQPLPAGPGMPMAPVPQAAPGAPPVMGGGPSRRPPFPSSVGEALAPPVAEAVPEGPAPVVRPKAPDAQGPTRSKLLDAAYSIMRDANPYESGNGQELYQAGLAEQGKNDENATERKQHLIDAEYDTDRGMYAAAQNQDRSAAIRGREDVIARNAAAIEKHGDRVYSYGVHKEDQAFTAGENAKSRANSLQIARESRAAAAAKSGGASGQWSLSDDETAALNKAAGEGRVDVTRLNSRTAKITAGILMANPGFDAMTNHGMAALISNAPAQQKAGMAAMLPDVLKNVRDAGSKLNLSDVQPMGRLQLTLRGQLNDPDVAAYMTQRNDALMTLAQVMRGTGATDKATAMENDAAPKSMSPRSWNAWYEGQLKALQPRIDMYERQRLLPKNNPPASGGWGKATVVK